MWDFVSFIFDLFIELWPWSHEPGGRGMPPWLAWTLGLLLLGLIGFCLLTCLHG
jgi:hypothetical protein